VATNDKFKVGDKVIISSHFPGTNGKEATVTKPHKWECDVKLGGYTYLIHKSQLTKVEK
jgi:hypothetical protein